MNRQTDVFSGLEKIGNINCSIAYNKYGIYCVPTDGIINKNAKNRRKILNGEVYEEDTLDYIKDNYQSGSIIHAGALFGDFVPFLSKICNDKVFTFEPNPISFICLEITVFLNKLNNVDYKNIGLGDKNERGKLAVKNKSKKLFETSSFTSNFDECFKIKTKKIDDIIPKNENISLIHLDVEGYEKKVLEGAINTIKRCEPTLILETVPFDWIEKNLPNYYQESQFKEIHGNTSFKCI